MGIFAAAARMAAFSGSLWPVVPMTKALPWAAHNEATPAVAS